MDALTVVSLLGGKLDLSCLQAKVCEIKSAACKHMGCEVEDTRIWDFWFVPLALFMPSGKDKCRIPCLCRAFWGLPMAVSAILLFRDLRQSPVCLAGSFAASCTCDVLLLGGTAGSNKCMETMVSHTVPWITS